MIDIVLEDDHYCFGCGADNKLGLCIDWEVRGNRTFAWFTPRREFQGWKGIVHGGILATLLDEAMTRLAWVARGGALTAEMTVRYLKPVRLGQKIRVEGEIVRENRKIVEMRAQLYVEDPASGGRLLVARSEGKAVKVHPDRVRAQRPNLP